MPGEIGKDVKSIVEDLANASPIIKVGKALGKVGETIQGGARSVERKVREYLPKKKVRRDINLPRSGMRRRTR